MEALIQKVSSQTAYKKFLNSVYIFDAMRQAKNANFDEFPIDEIDWDFMLRIADLQALSKTQEMLDKSLRVAQACLHSEACDLSLKERAVYILKKVSNYPAIELARERELFVQVEREPEENAVSKLANMKLENYSSIFFGKSKSFTANEFQRDFWFEADSNQVISVSAPTAAGKSFIFSKYILKKIESSHELSVLYIVPSRALISQVEADLKEVVKESGKKVDLVTLPRNKKQSESEYSIYIFTQERLHFFLNDHPNKKFDLAIIDEAHKLTDSYRGILLQHAILKLANDSTKIIYATPFSKNPEELLTLHPKVDRKRALYSSAATVNQNIFWLTQAPRRSMHWELTQVIDEPKRVGEVILKNKPTNQMKRLAFLAYEIGSKSYGNIVYVNGPADAEKAALLIKDCILTDKNREKLTDDELTELAGLCGDTIHRKYALIECLKFGVAFHYGNIPQLIRNKIEELFKKNKITFLICTSTLIEGVNMSCKNIFVRGPRKGIRTMSPMSPEDFWNLAGRAGRWGKEFQGNIYCIDTDVVEQWPLGPPSSREPYTIKTSVSKELTKVKSLIEYLKNNTPRSEFKNHVKDEYLISYLLEALKSEQKSDLVFKELSKDDRDELIFELERIYSYIDFEPEIIFKNPGISPFAMNELLDYFKTKKESELSSLVPSDVSSYDAVDSYTRLFHRINKYLAPNAFGSKGRVFMLALLVNKWMRGYSISRLISDREERDKRNKLPSIIRQVLTDVEEIARFRAPKYISCYLDILRFYFNSIDRSDLLEGLDNIQLSLACKVGRRVQAGLQKTAKIRVRTGEIKWKL